MEKIVLAVVLMSAAPAVATVDFTAVPEAGGVAIYYDATGEPNLVRSFALDITADSGATITAITNYKEGVSVSGDKGYGIFPGSIDINEAGDINDAGTPVADPCQLPSDTLGGLGTDGITIEMGSLYVGAANAPDPCGLLCKIQVSADCNLTVAENVGRGRVVMEGGGQAITNLPIVVVWPVPTECYKDTSPGYDTWVLFGRPDCWCYRKQCRGDTDGLSVFGKPVTGTDLDLFKLAFNTITADLLLIPNGICADLNHTSVFGKQVTAHDLDTFKQYFMLPDADVPECPESIIHYWTN